MFGDLREYLLHMLGLSHLKALFLTYKETGGTFEIALFVKFMQHMRRVQHAHIVAKLGVSEKSRLLGIVLLSILIEVIECSCAITRHKTSRTER